MRCVRNPMYLGRYFILLGGIMLLGHWWLLVLFTVVYYFYMVNRVKREEEYLRGPLGAPYEDYLRTVNRFLPGAPKPGSRIAFWDWRLLKQQPRHDEPGRHGGVLAIALGLGAYGLG